MSLPVSPSSGPGHRAAAFRAWVRWAAGLCDIPGGAAVGALTLSLIAMSLSAFVLTVCGRAVDLPSGFTACYCTAVGGFSIFAVARRVGNGRYPPAPPPGGYP